MLGYLRYREPKIVVSANEFCESRGEPVVEPCEYDFNESLGVWLSLTTQAYHRRLSERLAPHGITFRQAQVFGWLAMSGELAQSELAAKMLVEPPTVVRLLDRLEAAGLIQRVTVPEDRRRHVVRLTSAAAAVWKQITSVARELRQEAAQVLTQEELETLKKLLERVHGHLERHDSARKSSSRIVHKKVPLHV